MSMDAGLLVATQLSSLSSSQATSIPLTTARRGVPLPSAPRATDPPAEHATYSSLLHTAVTGTILLRVLHGGLILELISLSTEVPPLRFVFPSAVLSSPGIFLWRSDELQVLAVTEMASLYRLVIPLTGGRELWLNQITNVYSREYLIKNIVGTFGGLVHAQGIHCVAIGLPNGSLLRLETDHAGDDSNDGWAESLFQHTSFFSSLTSFIPTLGSGIPGGSEIISMATHPWPSDIGHIWTLSRDRTLRFWKAKIGCVASKTLSSALYARDFSPTPGIPVNAVKSHLLLDPEHQTLLRVFSTNSHEEHIYVLAFIPTISSPSFGGSFHLLHMVADQLYEIGIIECSKNTTRCHLQDFMVFGNSLCTLWDRQGQSMVEKTVINIEDFSGHELRSAVWHTATYAPEPELTAAYLEERLLSPGSLTDKFFEAIMRPGIFSALTLSTAIDQYTDSCLSLPGPRPPQLAATYATIGDHIAAVVGCTVNLNRDTQTGALQHLDYWNALKRDWEGFFARCREIERGARWPIALGVQEQGEIIIIERERLGSLVGEDLPIYVHRMLAREEASISSQYDLLAILRTLRSRLGGHVILNLEKRLIDIMHQEIAFSFADILQDQARRSGFMDGVDEGSASWIVGRLESIEDIDAATRTALDVIGGFDMEIKREEDEVEFLLPPPHSEWSRALTAAYITKTVDARYDLCLSLVTMLFFLSDELAEWDPSLLTEIFAVFRGVAMLRFVTRHPAGDTSIMSSAPGDFSISDHMISRMRNLNVARDKSHVTPTYSLVHRLLTQSGDSHGLPRAAHRFLDATGLLQSVSPAHATKFEILFCERLRLLGYYEAARELLSWLPRTAGASYVLARLWLDLGRADDASHLMETLAGSFGADNALSPEDHGALLNVLPAADLLDSQFSFYLHASALFRSSSLVYHEVLFAQLAISVAPLVDTSSLWYNVIKGYTDLALYEEAYASLMSTPYEKQRRECVSELIYRMCENNAVDLLMSFNFVGVADEVEDALSFKARNVDPRVRPLYSRILYAWYIHRGDYRNAALAMYQRARKLQDKTTDSTSFVSLAEEQLEAYTLAINSLSLLDEKNAWVLLPVPSENAHEPRRRRKLSRHIPETKYSPGTRDAEIVHLADIRYDYALLSTQVDVIQRDPALLSSAEFLPVPSLLVLRLAQANRFTQAIATACSLKADMTDLFTHLTGQCLRLSRNPGTVIQEDTSDWLLTDRVSSWPGTPADRGWRFLRQSLHRHDGAETDYRYTKVTLETILSVDKSSPPPWLIHTLEGHQHEYLIRVSLRYDDVKHAVKHTLAMIRKSDTRLARDSPKNAFSTWLPYTLIDQVLVAATAQDVPPPGLLELRSEVANRVKRVQKLSDSACTVAKE